MHLWKKETQFGKGNRIKNKRILMVCLGNICRSPLAQGAMEFLAKKNSLKIFVDSAGTEAWHTGQSPDQRAQKVAIAKSWDITSQKSRKIFGSDFVDYLVSACVHECEETKRYVSNLERQRYLEIV